MCSNINFSLIKVRHLLSQEAEACIVRSEDFRISRVLLPIIFGRRVTLTVLFRDRPVEAAYELLSKERMTEIENLIARTAI